MRPVTGDTIVAWGDPMADLWWCRGEHDTAADVVVTIGALTEAVDLRPLPKVVADDMAEEGVPLTCRTCGRDVRQWLEDQRMR